jgi:hypothetical protein
MLKPALALEPMKSAGTTGFACTPCMLPIRLSRLISLGHLLTFIGGMLLASEGGVHRHPASPRDPSGVANRRSVLGVVREDLSHLLYRVQEMQGPSLNIQIKDSTVLTGRYGPFCSMVTGDALTSQNTPCTLPG